MARGLTFASPSSSPSFLHKRQEIDAFIQVLDVRLAEKRIPREDRLSRIVGGQGAIWVTPKQRSYKSARYAVAKGERASIIGNICALDLFIHA
jgi:hypothetical protein